MERRPRRLRPFGRRQFGPCQFGPRQFGPCATAVASVAAVALLVAACGDGSAAPGGSPSTSGGSAPGHVQTRTATAGDVTVTLRGPSTATVGSRVRFAATWRDPRAFGAVGPSSLRFGDGTSEVFVQPQFCRASPQSVRSSTTFVHRYTSAGRFVVSLAVVANCSRGAVTTVRLPVRLAG